MITATNIYVQYGDRILLNNVNLVIGTRDKIGLVGRNGAGKSTLLKILTRQISPGSGSISMPNQSTVGFLKQEIDLKHNNTVIEETMTAFDEMLKLQAKIDKLNEEIATRTDYESKDYEKLLNEFSEASDRFQILGGFNMRSEAERVLKGLGFKPTDLDRNTEEFSGGWQMRIELAKLLLRKPDYLFLDEPNNHLDIEAIIWLEQFLRNYEGAVVIISHDKMFLDNTTQRTIEVELGNLYDYKAHYSKYVALRAERREKMEAEYRNQQQKIAQTEKLINKFRAKASKAKFAQSLIKQLDRMDKIELEDLDTKGIKIQFPPAPRSGQIVLQGKNVTKNYGKLKVLQGVDLKLDRGEKLAFVGQNGQGKTTLSRILIGNLPATKGDIEIGHNVHIGYYAQNQAESLPLDKTLLETIEEDAPADMLSKVRNILGTFLFSGEDVEKKVRVLSGGERARLALACLMLRPVNLLILDEPTNHLDISSKDILKQALLAYDGTMIVVSHDRDFLQGLTDKTIEFRDHKLFEHLGDINEFLNKRNLQNMREAALKPGKKNNGQKEEAKPERSYHEQKEWDKEKRKLEKKVQQAERKLEKTESRIATIEKEMSEAGFYESPDAQKKLDEYKSLKGQVDDVMLEWEEAQEKLDDFLES